MLTQSIQFKKALDAMQKYYKGEIEFVEKHFSNVISDQSRAEARHEKKLQQKDKTMSNMPRKLTAAKQHIIKQISFRDMARKCTVTGSN